MLGDNIKKYRAEAKLSQSELAERLYVTRQAVSNWERGISEPDVEMLLRISKELHISIENLIGDEEEKEVFSRRTTRILLSLQLLLILLIIILRFSTDYIQNMGTLLFLSFYPFMSGTLYLIFGYMYKSNDFSLLSGYDSRMHYDLNQLKRVVSAQETWINFINIIHMSLQLLLFILNINDGRSFIVLMFTYLLSMVIGVLKIDHAHMDGLYTKEVDYLKAKHQMKITYFLLAAVFLPILIVMGAELIGFESIESDNLYIVGLIVLTSLPIPTIIIESERIHKMVEAKEDYRLGKVSIGILVTCFIGNMIFTWQMIGF